MLLKNPRCSPRNAHHHIMNVDWSNRCRKLLSGIGMTVMHVKDCYDRWVVTADRSIMQNHRAVPSFKLSYRLLILGFRVQLLIFPSHLVPSGEVQVSGRRRNKLTQVTIYKIVHQCSGDRWTDITDNYYKHPVPDLGFFICRKYISTY